jgi:hypothetical protein
MYCESHTKPITALCGQNAEFLNVKITILDRGEDKYWVQLVDLEHSTVHLGNIKLQCTKGNIKSRPKIVLFSVCTAYVGGPWLIASPCLRQRIVGVTYKKGKVVPVLN